MSDEIELQIIKQEEIRNAAIDSGAGYCHWYCANHVCHKGCTIEGSVYRKRMDRGNELFDTGMSHLEVENVITAEYPCEHYVPKHKLGDE